MTTKTEIQDALNSLLDMKQPNKFIAIEKLLEIEDEAEMIKQARLLVQTKTKWYASNNSVTRE